MTDEHTDHVTDDELTEALAEATDSTPEEIREGAEAVDLGPPWEGEVIAEECDADPTSPEARLAAAKKQLRLAREAIDDEGAPDDPTERLKQSTRRGIVTDALAAADAALAVERGENEALREAMEAGR